MHKVTVKKLAKSPSSQECVRSLESVQSHSSSSMNEEPKSTSQDFFHFILQYTNILQKKKQTPNGKSRLCQIRSWSSISSKSSTSLTLNASTSSDSILRKSPMRLYGGGCDHGTPQSPPGCPQYQCFPATLCVPQMTLICCPQLSPQVASPCPQNGSMASHSGTNTGRVSRTSQRQQPIIPYCDSPEGTLDTIEGPYKPHRYQGLANSSEREAEQFAHLSRRSPEDGIGQFASPCHQNGSMTSHSGTNMGRVSRTHQRQQPIIPYCDSPERTLDTIEGPYKPHRYQGLANSSEREQFAHSPERTLDTIEGPYKPHRYQGLANSSEREQFAHLPRPSPEDGIGTLYYSLCQQSKGKCGEPMMKCLTVKDVPVSDSESTEIRPCSSPCPPPYNPALIPKDFSNASEELEIYQRNIFLFNRLVQTSEGLNRVLKMCNHLKMPNPKNLHDFVLGITNIMRGIVAVYGDEDILCGLKEYETSREFSSPEATRGHHNDIQQSEQMDSSSRYSAPCGAGTPSVSGGHHSSSTSKSSSRKRHHPGAASKPHSGRCKEPCAASTPKHKGGRPGSGGVPLCGAGLSGFKPRRSHSPDQQRSPSPARSKSPCPPVAPHASNPCSGGNVSDDPFLNPRHHSFKLSDMPPTAAFDFSKLCSGRSHDLSSIGPKDPPHPRRAPRALLRTANMFQQEQDAAQPEFERLCAERGQSDISHLGPADTPPRGPPRRLLHSPGLTPSPPVQRKAVRREVQITHESLQRPHNKSPGMGGSF